MEKETATHSSIPAWKTPWMEEPGGLQFVRLQRVDITERLSAAHGAEGRAKDETSAPSSQ